MATNPSLKLQAAPASSISGRVGGIGGNARFTPFCRIEKKRHKDVSGGDGKSGCAQLLRKRPVKFSIHGSGNWSSGSKKCDGILPHSETRNRIAVIAGKQHPTTEIPKSLPIFPAACL